MEKREVTVALAVMLSRLPEWVRSDLVSKDLATRGRAEETLVAMAMAAMFVDNSTQEG
ncbi:MAG: hypothetical protein AB7G25_02950 [Sphingomonadaceae bacterium]